MKVMNDFVPAHLVECDLFEFRRYASNLDCEFSQDLAESPDGEELTVMQEYFTNATGTDVLALRLVTVDEEGNESEETFIDPDYRNTCIDLEMAHPELFR